MTTTLDAVEFIIRRPADGPHLAGAVACLLLVTAVRWIDSTPADHGSGRAIPEGGRGGAAPTLEARLGAWAARQDRVLPTSMRILAGGSVVAMTAMAAIVLRRAGLLGHPARWLGPAWASGWSARGGSCEFSGRGDEEIRDRWGPMMTALRERELNRNRPVLDSRGEVLDRHRDERRSYPGDTSSSAGV